MTKIRLYQLSDFDECLRLFDGNTPDFFDATERTAFCDFLRTASQTFYVVERCEKILACGGYALGHGDNVASLCWGMVDQKLHGQGLGRALIEARLSAIRALPSIKMVCISTSQHTQRFYGRFGFVPVKVTPDGHGPGMDCWDMTLQLRQ
ncbi:hypothetical protein JH25_18935 [Pseudomonas sp. BRG-100]|uniref:GNAT family N-acetyltransferase n=1 Tax=Pseudomonas sp. BRG-100 TaxID=1524267 RepID=UPI0004E6F2F9|nr:GNAT family N-acetyltransferase [Pseudomonas sp. BRG-100]KFF45798.1 hypothetical protein JH25_18935 [Pseudomonas sp. BRG-100]